MIDAMEIQTASVVMVDAVRDWLKTVPVDVLVDRLDAALVGAKFTDEELRAILAATLVRAARSIEPPF